MAHVGGAPRSPGRWLVALVVLAALPASGASAAGWTPAHEVSEAAVETNGAQLGVDEAGDVTAAWVSVGTYPSGSIKSAYLPAGGAWQPIQVPISTTTCERPSLAVDSSGAAVVVADCGSGRMKAAFRPTATGAWGSAVELPGSESSVEPEAAIDGSGNAIVIWNHEGTIQSSYRPASTGTWGNAQSISAAGVGSFPEARVAMNSTGLAVAAWSDDEGVNTYVINGKMRGPGSAAAWEAAKKLSPATSGAEAFSPEIALNTEGLIVAWSQKAAAGRFVIDNAWGGGCNECGWGEDASSHQQGTSDRSVEQPAVAIDGGGRSIAVWRAAEAPDVSGTPGIQASATPSINGLWSTPLPLTMPALSYLPSFAPPPQIAGDGAGDASAVWAAAGEPSGSVFAATRAPGQTLSGTVKISNSNGVETSSETRFPTPVTMDAGGDSFAAWATVGSGRRLAFAMRDGSPPTLSGIVVPVSGETGVPVSMSATASDIWSPPATVRWDFGDGTSGNGATVSHTYSAPGTYTASLSAGDAQGNVSAARTRQIAVTAGPGGEVVKPAVGLRFSVVRQSWKAIAGAKAIEVKCGLDASGACAVAATIGATTAKGLGLPAKGGGPVTLGRGSLLISAGQTGTVRVKLTPKALKAIGASAESLAVALTATGSAPGHRDTTQTKKLKIKRPKSRRRRA